MAKAPVLSPVTVTLPNGQRWSAQVTKTQAAELNKALMAALAQVDATPVGNTPELLTQVREWAKATGVPVGARGRISREIIQQYRDSQKGSKSKAKVTPAKPSTSKAKVTPAKPAAATTATTEPTPAETVSVLVGAAA